MSNGILSPFGDIPNDWEYQIVIDNVDFLTGPTFDSRLFNTESRGARLVRGINLTKGSTRWSEERTKYWDVELDSFEKFQLAVNDILIGMDGSLVGKNYAYLKDSDLPALLVQRVARLRSKENLHSKYLYYMYATDFWLDYVEVVKTNSGIPHISNGDIKNFRFPFPPLSEQQKIAAILTSVDDVIEKTQAQINKLKDIKTGMMQELLTRGVGVDGKPHTEFKDSPVGRIPKGWDCCLLDKVAKRGSGHTPDKQKPEYWNGGIKWVSLTDSSKLDKLHLYKTLKEISQLGIDNSSATLHPSGTVVMARDAGVGKSAIIQSPMAVSQHFMAWVCSDKLDNYFLYYLLQYWKPKFENIAMGSTIKTIGLPFFKKLQIPLPSIDEQKIIAKSLKAVENNIFKLEEKNAKNQAMKKALMQDLLTGKVRVNVE